MNVQELIIDKKKYVLIPAKEYATVLEDLSDIKLVLERRKETGMEANAFFNKLKNKNRLKANLK